MADRRLDFPGVPAAQQELEQLKADTTIGKTVAAGRAQRQPDTPRASSSGRRCMRISDEEDDDEPDDPRTQRGRSSVISSDAERFDDDDDEHCDQQGSDDDASPAVEMSDSENDLDAHGIGAGGSSSSGGGARQLIEPGSVMMHKQKGLVKIIRLGNPSDFFNANRVYISFQKTLSHALSLIDNVLSDLPGDHLPPWARSH